MVGTVAIERRESEWCRMGLSYLMVWDGIWEGRGGELVWLGN